MLLRKEGRDEMLAPENSLVKWRIVQTVQVFKSETKNVDAIILQGFTTDAIVGLENPVDIVLMAYFINKFLISGQETVTDKVGEI